MLRGINRDAVFLEDEDRVRFLTALRAARDASGFSVLAYCLMDNHVHLVLRAGGESIGSAVKRIAVRYAGWFNRKYGRVGHVFQDRFKSVPVDDDAHLAVLLRYVWNNPVEAGLAADPEDYPWGSRGPLGGASGLVDTEALARLLSSDPLPCQHLPTMPLWDPPGRPGPRSRYTDDDVARLLVRTCGADSPQAFLALDEQAQHRAVHELRARSVPYAQLARHTGLSSTTLKRVQAARAAAT